MWSTFQGFILEWAPSIGSPENLKSKLRRLAKDKRSSLFCPTRCFSSTLLRRQGKLEFSASLVRPALNDWSTFISKVGSWPYPPHLRVKPGP